MFCLFLWFIFRFTVLTCTPQKHTSFHVRHPIFSHALLLCRHHVYEEPKKLIIRVTLHANINICIMSTDGRIDIHPHSDHGTDRRLSHARDPLRRSGDTAASDPPSMAERGGHGRDGPVLPRDPTTTIAGGNTCRTVAVAGNERDRTIYGFKAGEEELPMEVPGRYEKMRVLGRGSFGAVTLVKDNRDSKLYAMKTLNCADKLEDRVTAMAEVCMRACARARMTWKLTLS